MDVGVVGLGKLGLPLALVFAKAGFDVFGVDTSRQRIGQISSFRNGSAEYQEPQVTEYLKKYTNFRFSTDYRLLSKVPIIYVITQTPSLPNGFFDIEHVAKAVRGINEVNKDALVVVSSNINIGTIDKLSRICKRICFNPEFVAQGTVIRNFENPRFVVVGAYTNADGEQVSAIWRKAHDKPIYIVKPIEAELIKLSLNFSYSFGITFANMIGEVCEKLSVDSCKTLDLIYQDRRKYKAGLGFGGPCFPRDVDCFKATCNEIHARSGYNFAKLLNNLNAYTMGKYVREIKLYGKKNIGVLGIAYKANVPYTYGSRSLKVARQLQSEGYTVRVYDPMVQKETEFMLNDIHFCSSMDECINKSDVIFIGTPNYANVEINKPFVNPWACMKSPPKK